MLTRRSYWTSSITLFLCWHVCLAKLKEGKAPGLGHCAVPPLPPNKTNNQTTTHSSNGKHELPAIMHGRVAARICRGGGEDKTVFSKGLGSEALTFPKPGSVLKRRFIISFTLFITIIFLVSYIYIYRVQHIYLYVYMYVYMHRYLYMDGYIYIYMYMHGPQSMYSVLLGAEADVQAIGQTGKHAPHAHAKYLRSAPNSRKGLSFS